MGTAAHAIHSTESFHNPNVVKLIVDASGHAMYFSRAAIPFWRDGATAQESSSFAPLRHIGIDRIPGGTFAGAFQRLAQRRMNRPRRWSNCARYGTDTGSPYTSATAFRKGSGHGRRPGAGAGRFCAAPDLSPNAGAVPPDTGEAACYSRKRQRLRVVSIKKWEFHTQAQNKPAVEPQCSKGHYETNFIGRTRRR
jgi:phosphoribosyl-AMP cyclohydrolase